MELQIEKHRVTARRQRFHHGRAGSSKQFQSHLEPLAFALQPLHQLFSGLGVLDIERHNQPLARFFHTVRL